MLIDCDGCGARGDGCADCLVTALFGASPGDGLGGAEVRAIEVFARAGFVVEVLPEPRRPAGRTRPGRRRVA
jgi:hypothetical protein